MGLLGSRVCEEECDSGPTALGGKNQASCVKWNPQDQVEWSPRHVIRELYIIYHNILSYSIVHIILFYIKPCYIILYCQTIVAGCPSMSRTENTTIFAGKRAPNWAPKSGEKVSEHSSYLISWQIYGLFIQTIAQFIMNLITWHVCVVLVCAF